MAAGDASRPALPRRLIAPLRLLVYAVLAGCSAYVYFHAGELTWTHYLVLMSVVAVAAMVLLDCRMSERYWREREGEG